MPVSYVQTATILNRRVALRPEIRTELIRKGIHMLIAGVPTLSAVAGSTVAMVVLAVGTLAYAYAEQQRQHGIDIPIISRITELASRKRDLNHYVLGPVTLGLGAMLALMLYPAPAATIAIYALAFGDGVASIAGRLVGRTTLPGTGGKTLEGSMACFIAVAIAASWVLESPGVVFVVALSAAVIEALPTGDADNLLLPAGVGLIASTPYL